jgi:hypothetical protein
MFKNNLEAPLRSRQIIVGLGSTDFSHGLVSTEDFTEPVTITFKSEDPCQTLLDPACQGRKNLTNKPWNVKRKTRN